WHKFFTNWLEKESTVIELFSQLEIIYQKNYAIKERELYAWQAMLRASGCHNITPWTQDESKLQLWTKSPDHITEKSTIHSLYKMGFLVSMPIHMSNNTNTFWPCFKKALKGNKKNQDGKRRTLSIIANDFTYQELKTNLNLTHAINRHVKFGFTIESGEDIEMAIKNTAGIHVANLEPNRVKDKTKKLGTIAGITNWNEWVWPDEGVEK
ncbi:6248_t:CDS:2, partial [Entrophospora sp. SA101]